jgi:hypothetical protein
MDKILKHPIIPHNVYEEYRDLKRKPISDNTSMKNLLNHLVIDGVAKNNNQVSILAKLILFDLKNFINHPSIFKENSTARALENRLSILGNGRTSDALTKTNPDISVLLSQAKLDKIPINVQAKICSNFREKGDAIFYNPKKDNSYKVSIKSLVPDNKEINFGAFDFTSLVSGLLDDRFLALGERKSKLKLTHKGIDYELGRGSRIQLENLFKYIKAIGKIDEFIERWEIVFSGVFKEDIFIFIKDFKILRIYILSNENFKKCISDSLRAINTDSSKSVINRWEGNSVRMSRDIIIDYCDFKIEKNFSEFFDEKKIISKIKDIDFLKQGELMKITDF